MKQLVTAKILKQLIKLKVNGNYNYEIFDQFETEMRYEKVMFRNLESLLEFNLFNLK